MQARLRAIQRLYKPAAQGGIANGSRERTPDDSFRVFRQFVCTGRRTRFAVAPYALPKDKFTAANEGLGAISFVLRRPTSWKSRARTSLRTKQTTDASRPPLDFHDQGSPKGNKKPRQPGEWMTMLALVEGHPNIDVMVFYVLASAVLAATLYYYFHTRPDRNRRTE